MYRRVFEIYQRKRIININVNIISAGLLALALALIPVHYTRSLGISNKMAIAAIGTSFDILFDVAIFYMLHWIANHWKPRWAAKRQNHSRRRFFRDATLIQFERALFAPLFYVVQYSLNFSFQQVNIEREWALVWGTIISITLTRIVHTLWGLKTGRFRDDFPEQTNADSAARDDLKATDDPQPPTHDQPQD